jgi:phosphoglucomutase
MLVNVPKLITSYYSDVPDPMIAAQRVAFGTSGHRGSSFKKSFNEWHILAITQAICLYRKQQGINGPLFLGLIRMHFQSRQKQVRLRYWLLMGWKLCFQRMMNIPRHRLFLTPFLPITGRKTGLADGIVITPSHNPPHDGGFKYNPPNGGPANLTITDWIGMTANTFLEAKLQGVKRDPL